MALSFAAFSSSGVRANPKVTERILVVDQQLIEERKVRIHAVAEHHVAHFMRDDVARLASSGTTSINPRLSTIV